MVLPFRMELQVKVVGAVQRHNEACSRPGNSEANHVACTLKLPVTVQAWQDGIGVSVIDAHN